MDDGSLVISYRYNNSKQTLHCYYHSIILYMLNFSPAENQQLANHLNKTFHTNFVVSGHPHGKGSLLKINREEDVRYFFQLIQRELGTTIPSMQYKLSINANIQSKEGYLTEKYGKDIKINMSSSNRNRNYTMEEMDNIIQMKLAGQTDEAIANQLNRTYWSILYKLKELRKEGDCKTYKILQPKMTGVF
ncbi:hypothetical protein [Oceanobacillus kapialis]|uniref:hypothetical protein n=1 Tax=Oceanobacillus kapialis TaxID=481353 RepID=UPI00384DF71F